MLLVQQQPMITEQQIRLMNIQYQNTINALLQNALLTNMQNQQKKQQTKRKLPKVPTFDEPAKKSQSLIDFQNKQQCEEIKLQNKKISILTSSIDQVLMRLDQNDGNIQQKSEQILYWIIQNNQDFLKNKKMTYLAATIIILSCVSLNIAISVSKVCAYLEVKENIINIYLKTYSKISNQSQQNETNQQESKEINEPVIEKALKKLNLSEEIKESGKNIFEQINRKKLQNGQSEEVIASCSINMACIVNQKQSSSEIISQVCEANNKDVNEYYLSIFPYRFHLLNNNKNGAFYLQINSFN